MTDPAPGLLTARAIADRTGRSPATINTWMARRDFPSPVDRRGPRQARRWDPADVDRFLADHPELGPAEVDLTGIDRNTPITLSGFARLAGVDPHTVGQYRHRPGFPPAGPDGLRQVGALADFWAARPGQGRPATGTRAPRAGRQQDHVADMLRQSIAAGQMLTAADVADRLDVSDRIAGRYLAAALPAVAVETGLVGLRSIADQLPGTAAATRYTAALRLFRQSDAPQPVAMQGKERLYRPADVAGYLQGQTAGGNV